MDLRRHPAQNAQGPLFITVLLNSSASFYTLFNFHHSFVWFCHVDDEKSVFFRRNGAVE